MTTIDKILKYTESYLAKNAKERLAFSFIQKENDYQFTIRKVNYNFTNIELDGKNPTLKTFMEWLSKKIIHNQSIHNPLLIQDETYINQAIRTWYRNIIKLNPTEEEYALIHPVLFFNIRDRELLNYLELDKELEIKDVEKIKYLKVALESYNATEISESDLNAVLLCLSKFNKINVDENLIVDLFDLALKKYKIMLDNYNHETKIITFVRNELSKDKLKTYIDWYPSYKYIVMPNQQEEKKTLFVKEENANAVIVLDIDYLMQQYPMLSEIEIKQVITNVMGTIRKEKSLLNLLIINEDNLKKVSVISLLGIDESPINVNKVKAIFNHMLEAYISMKLNRENITDDYLSKAFHMSLLQYEIPINEEMTKKPKI